MEKITLNLKLVCLLMAYSLLLATVSCTKDSTDDDLYDQQAKRPYYSPLHKPVVDKRDIRTGPDRGGENPMIFIDSYNKD